MHILQSKVPSTQAFSDALNEHSSANLSAEYNVGNKIFMVKLLSVHWMDQQISVNIIFFFFSLFCGNTLQSIDIQLKDCVKYLLTH